MRESRVNEQKKLNETTMHHYPKVYTPNDVSKSIEQAFTNVAIREQIIERGQMLSKLASNMKQGTTARNFNSRLGVTTPANLSTSLWDNTDRNPNMSTKLHMLDQRKKQLLNNIIVKSR
jgi:capsular polysaccharide biosynthesis protein